MDDKKIAFIFGSTKEEVGIYEGEIEKIGSIKDQDVHSTCLADFGKEKYPERGFKIFNSKYAPTTISYYFIIEPLYHAVFLNTTKYLDNGSVSYHGKTGILILPNKITDKQKESLEKFLDEIYDYSIHIEYDLKNIDGFIEGSDLKPEMKENPISIFNHYLEKTNNKSL